MEGKREEEFSTSSLNFLLFQNTLSYLATSFLRYSKVQLLEFYIPPLIV